VHSQLVDTIPSVRAVKGCITAFVCRCASRMAFSACAAGKITMERNKLCSAIINAEPTIYKAVADRIGLLPYPVVQFYMRMVEIQMVEIQNAVQIAVVGPGDEIPGEEAETIAKSVIIACRLARAIISHASGQSVDEEISRITLVHIDEALDGASVFANGQATDLA
jgi:hypothetical protein